MSDCRIGLKAPKPIHGQIVWGADQRPTPLSYARYVNGVERFAVYIELDGERYERAMTCRLELEPNSDRLWWCSNCHSYHEHVSNYPWERCPRCGARVRGGGDD